MAYPPHLNYLKDSNIVWFNPCWGYFGFWKRLAEFRKEKKIDFKTAWLSRGMKRNKELYATALLALSMRQDAPMESGWWFTKPLSDPPDGVIGTIVKRSSGNIINVREVEVVEYFGGDLLDTFKNKMKNKSYEPNTALVCLLSPNSTEVLDLIKLSKQIQSLKFPLTYIFVVFHGLEIVSLPEKPTVEDLVKVTLVQLAPEYVPINFSPQAVCQSWRTGGEQSWIKFAGRGLNNDLVKIKTENAPKLFD
ncbi:MAG: hypothetical protein PHS62_01415 [Patescibacteria group bacterium]|nr:hypothetical protein [Patescibacteria group bacterium]